MVAVPHIFHLLPAFMMNGALPSQCGLKFDIGNNVTCSKPSAIKFHFDTLTGFCMNFKYLGCKGNDNRFDSFGECVSKCITSDYQGCPFQRNPVIPLRCSSHKDCNRQTGDGNMLYCTREGICCESKDLEELRREFNVSCPKHQQTVQYTYKSSVRLLIGKSCAAQMCPANSTCHQKKYLAYCCQTQ